jgi:hypothetical protein
VTDPKKAVLVLKWVVKEMENRYKMMSYIGVRNIQNFNQKIEESIASGAELFKIINLGFDKGKGENITEKIIIEKKKFHYIVVIVDEMADLMLVAGKEIEEPDDIDKRVALLDRMMEGMEEGIQKTKNEEVMQQMLTGIVEPLFRKVFDKVLKISPLFAGTEFTYFIDGGGSQHNNINDLIENIEIGWEQKQKNKHEIGKIDLHIYLSKLKKLGTKAFDMNDEIKINFEKHKYQIVLQQNETIDRLYHQILSSEKIDEVAAKFVNTMISRIEDQVKAINENGKN